MLVAAAIAMPTHASVTLAAILQEEKS